jgi:enoyl-CoA hydratase/carnithine racemase
MNTTPVTKRGQTMSYSVHEGVLELALNRAPCNEIGSLSLEDLESFSAALQELEPQLHAVIIHSERKAGFCAGADLRELYDRSQAMEKKAAIRGVRDFLERIHRVLNTI